MKRIKRIRKKYNKKNLAIVLSATILIIIIIGAIMYTIFGKSASSYTSTIDGVEMKSFTQEVEFTTEIDYSPTKIQLIVMHEDIDVSDKLTYKEIEIKELDTYVIAYTYKEYTFEYTMKVVDMMKPVIDAQEEYYIELNTTFDFSILNIHATDNYDGTTLDISYSGDVNTSTKGSYPITVSTKDSSGNKASIDIQIIVSNTTPELPAAVIHTVSNPDDINVCIDKTHLLPDGWAPNDLVSVGGNHYLRAQAADAYNNMMAQSVLDGLHIVLVSSYRTQAYQTTLYNNYFAIDPENAPFYSAIPRSSEHELGLAIDVSYDNYLYDDLDDHAVGKWMIANAYKYGWIMSYPEDKTEVTGYMYEAWHFRYVGVELATYLTQNKITLQEYYY